MTSYEEGEVRGQRLNDVAGHEAYSRQYNRDADDSNGGGHPADLDRILAHLCQVSFSSDVTEDQRIVDAVRIALEEFNKTLTVNQCQEGVSIKLASEIASQILSEDIKRLNRRVEKKLIFEAALILLFSIRSPDCGSLQIDMASFLEEYPDFAPDRVGQEEAEKLLLFRNMLCVALLLIPARFNKGHLLDLVTRIMEGHHVQYITGSGETAATRRRVKIYETEGGIVARARPLRKGESQRFQLFEKAGVYTVKEAKRKLSELEGKPSGLSSVPSDDSKKRGRPSRSSSGHGHSASGSTSLLQSSDTFVQVASSQPMFEATRYTYRTLEQTQPMTRAHRNSTKSIRPTTTILEPPSFEKAVGQFAATAPMLSRDHSLTLSFQPTLPSPPALMSENLKATYGFYQSSEPRGYAPRFNEDFFTASFDEDIFYAISSL
jgi:hypothetical protein